MIDLQSFWGAAAQGVYCFALCGLGINFRSSVRRQDDSSGKYEEPIGSGKVEHELFLPMFLVPQPIFPSLLLSLSLMFC